MTTLDIAAAPLIGKKLKPAQTPWAANAQFLGRLTGILFIVTFITSIPPVFSLYVPVLSDPAYILGAGTNIGLSWGAVLELLLLVANIGSAVVLFPVAKRQNEGLALGFIASRIMESAFIAVGILCLLAIGTLRGTAAGTDPATLTAIGKALVAIHDWSFRIGPGVVCGIGNGMILGYLMWRTKLVPRGLSILGLIGGPLIVLSGLAVVLGIISGGSMAQGIATIPEFFWELGFGLWLTVKGFNPTALAKLENSVSL
jgi:Domain of unknown function (DUF4386)